MHELGISLKKWLKRSTVLGAALGLAGCGSLPTGHGGGHECGKPCSTKTLRQWPVFQTYDLRTNELSNFLVHPDYSVTRLGDPAFTYGPMELVQSYGVFGPSESPDGAWINLQGKLYSRDNVASPLTVNVRQHSWAPDARSLVLIEEQSNGPARRLLVARPDTGAITELVGLAPFGAEPRAPDFLSRAHGRGSPWSADGTSVAYTLWYERGTELHVVRADGSGDQKLSASVFPCGDVWSSTSRLAYGDIDRAAGVIRLRITGVDGADSRVLREAPFDIEADAVPQGFSCRWSPRGDSIAIRDESGWTIMAPDGTNAHTVLPGARYWSDLDWSPDGEHVHIQDDLEKLRFARSDGGGIIDMQSHHPGNVIAWLGWSPNGAQAIYHDGELRIYDFTSQRETVIPDSGPALLSFGVLPNPAGSRLLYGAAPESTGQPASGDVHAYMSRIDGSDLVSVADIGPRNPLGWNYSNYDLLGAGWLSNDRALLLTSKQLLVVSADGSSATTIWQAPSDEVQAISLHVEDDGQVE